MLYLLAQTACTPIDLPTLLEGVSMTAETFADPTTATIVAFLREVGIPVSTATLTDPTFLPGILLSHGGIVVDVERLRFPGDLLHEAGHVAVSSPGRRSAIQGDAGPDPAEEMMAIAWSYAASVYLQLDPSVVFHADGYRGGSEALIENFTHQRYFGVPMLQWLGMTLDPPHASERGLAPYPHMLKWLRDT
jgi:hypothetical protein